MPVRPYRAAPPAARTLAPAVRCLNLALTYDCNLDCTYCFVRKERRRMSAETACKAVQGFLDRSMSGSESRVSINFFGGEPFLEMDCMEEVIAFARRQALRMHKQVIWSATTNATLATPRAERVIRGARMNLLVSLDGGPEASRSRPFRSGRSSYDLVARNLPRLTEWSPDAVVRMTFHPDALDLVGNVRHALSLGARSVALAAVHEADWGRHADGLDAAYQHLADWYIEEARRGQIVPLEVTHGLLRQLHHVRLGGERPSRPCGVGTTIVGVDPEGHWMPCHRFLYRPHDRLGSVNRPTTAEERARYVRLSTKDILGCDGCVARPVCGGGCRAVALNSGAGLHGTSPGFCIPMRAHARAAVRIYDTLMKEDSPAFVSSLRRPRVLSGMMAELVLG